MCSYNDMNSLCNTQDLVKTKWLVRFHEPVWTRSLLTPWPPQHQHSVLVICNADCNHWASVHPQSFSAHWRHPVLSPSYQWASLSCEPCSLPIFSLCLLLPDARLQEESICSHYKSVRKFVQAATKVLYKYFYISHISIYKGWKADMRISPCPRFVRDQILAVFFTN